MHGKARLTASTSKIWPQASALLGSSGGRKEFTRLPLGIGSFLAVSDMLEILTHLSEATAILQGLHG